MAASHSSDEIGSVQITEVLTCIICKSDVTSQLIQLNCFHVCHRNCLRRSLGNARPGSKFSCPECMTSSVLPTGGIEGIPEELLQYKVKETAAIFSNCSPPCNICEEVGEENVSTHYCITCKMHLCETDTKRHRLQPDHKIISIAEIQTEEYLPRILSSKRALCPIHSTDSDPEVLKFFCQQCQIPVCHVCNGTDHKSHKAISIQEASKKLKQDLKSKATDISTRKRKCKQVVEDLEKLLNEIDNNSKQQIEKCINWGEEVKQAVDKIVNKKIKNIENIAEVQKNDIKKLAEEKKYQDKHLKSSNDYMEVFLKFSSDSDILQKHKTFIENLNKSLEQEVAIEINTTHLEMELKNVKKIKNNLEKAVRVASVNEIHRFGTPQLIGFELETKWKIGGEGNGVAVDGEDVFCVDGKNIDVYGMNGQRKSLIECHGLKNACDIDIVNGRLFVSDCDKNKRQILVLDKRGNVERIISLPTKEYGPFFFLGQATSFVLFLALDHTNEDVYISSCITNTVYKCSKGQTMAQPFITAGLNDPQSICVTSQQELIVTNGGTDSVCKFNCEGKLVWKYEGMVNQGVMPNLLDGVCIDPWDHIFVCDQWNHRIHHLSPDGTFLSFIKIEDRVKFPKAITFKNRKLIVTGGIHVDPYNIIVIKCQYD